MCLAHYAFQRKTLAQVVSLLVYLLSHSKYLTFHQHMYTKKFAQYHYTCEPLLFSCFCLDKKTHLNPFTSVY